VLPTASLPSTNLTLLGAGCLSPAPRFFEFVISISKDLLVSAANFV
jgi:hypothetical protein